MKPWIEQMLALPRPGVPVEELTSQQKVALAIAAGVQVDSKIENTRHGYMFTLTTAVPVGFADLGDGKYTVFVRQDPATLARARIWRKP